jgi:hypothetical protein
MSVHLRNFSLSAEFSREEISSGLVRLNPMLMHEEIVYLIGDYQLLELDVLSPQSLHEHYRLAKVNVAIVIAVDQ